jgi:hypothetical protein
MKTSPSTFARLIDKVVGDLQNVVTYFDDLTAHGVRTAKIH